MARNYSSVVEPKTLTADVGTSDTQITLNNVTGLPAKPYVLVLNPDTAKEEAVLVTVDQTGVTSPTLKVTRAIEASGGLGTAQTHSVGHTVKHMIVGSDLQIVHDHISETDTTNTSTVTAHGVTGGVVGRTNTQTLTNKTLTSPVITGGTVNGGAALTVDSTELNYVDGVTSAIQTQLNTKAPLAAPTFTGTVVLPSTTSIGNVSATEIGYIDGVTSAVQTQLDAKLPLAGGTLTGNLASTGVAVFTTNTAAGRGVTIAQPPGNTDNAILQFTNNAASAQLGNITAGAGGTITLNPAGNNVTINGDLGVSNDVTCTNIWVSGQVLLDGDLNTYNGGDIYTDTGSIYNYVGQIDSVGCRPVNDNVGSVGSSTRRWVRVFAVNTTISSSDERDKLDINDSPLGLDFINDLRPVSYRWKVGEKTPVLDAEGKPVLDENGEAIFTVREGARKHYGLVSQEVKQAVDNSGAGDFAGWVQDDMSDPDSHQSISYEQFIAPLIKSVQELSAEVQTLKAKVAELEAN